MGHDEQATYDSDEEDVQLHVNNSIHESAVEESVYPGASDPGRSQSKAGPTLGRSPSKNLKSPAPELEEDHELNLIEGRMEVAKKEFDEDIRHNDQLIDEKITTKGKKKK